ncbi:cyd operon YbgE family protein [Oceanospirillum sp.]|uniref:cyd operon YbgE family protein n=1 Tax=Oceanospirillum sp. TaxID=2021254 RepID=UPI003A93782F
MTIPYPKARWTQALSLISAIIISVVLTAYPRLIAESIHEVDHGLFTLFMWAISAGFIHGVGFEPKATIWRLAFNPIIAWLIIVYGLVEYLIH